MIKLIATDIDGTLVKDGTLMINPEYMTVIEQANPEREFLFVVCSGRQFQVKRNSLPQSKTNWLYISDGGTVVRTPNEILKTYPMSDELWEKICIRWLKKNFHPVTVLPLHRITVLQKMEAARCSTG